MSKQPKRNHTRTLNSCHGSWSPKFGASRRKTTSDGVGPSPKGGGAEPARPPSKSATGLITATDHNGPQRTATETDYD